MIGHRRANPPADAVFAFPADPGATMLVVDLLDLLEGGASAGLAFGKTTAEEVEARLGQPSARWPDEDRLDLVFRGGMRIRTQAGRFARLGYDCLDHGGVAEAFSRGSDAKGYDNIGLTELYIGEGDACLRLGGRSIAYFSTLAKLIAYKPPGLDFDFDASIGPLDTAVLATTRRQDRVLWLVYALASFEVGQRRGQVHFDYCLRDAAVWDDAQSETSA